MIGKIITIIFALAIILFSVGYLYESLPGERVTLSIQQEPEQIVIPISYGSTPVFSEKMRFNHDQISFYIDSLCSVKRTNAMLDAFLIFERRMGIIKFHELDTSDADITIECPNEVIEVSEGYLAAGEGGPSEIIKTDLFQVINKGKIFLYEDPQCEYPIVEVHELLHVFGFNHTDNPKSAMYNISNCDQRITPDMVGTIQALYSIIPLADLYISNLSATKNNRYLDFNITIKNQGLLDSPQTTLTIFSEEKEIDEIELKDIEIGAGRTINIRNMKMFSKNIDEIEFAIDINNQISELDRKNNHIKMIISQ